MTLLSRYAVAWAYLAGFVVAELIYAALPSRDQAAALRWSSTNVVNLHHDPVGSLAASAFIPAAFAASWPLLIALALFGANRALGNWRTAVVCAAGHVLGTLVSEGIVDYRVTHGALPASATRILDVGPSYIVVAAAFFFLGFGGSRWSAPYVEKYIALAVGVGVKIMVLFLLIGVGMALSAAWVAVAQTVATSPNPAMGALDIVGESLIFRALCWFVPKIVAGVLGGSPAFTGGEIIAVATPIAYGAVMAAQTAVSLASSGIGALAGAGPGAGGAATASAAPPGPVGPPGMGGASASGGQPAPPALPTMNAGTGQPAPPSNNSAA